MRIDGRRPEQPRQTRVQPGILETAEGSALIEAGNTKVICSATVENRVPAFLRGAGTRLGDGGIRHAAKIHLDPDAAPRVARPSVGPHVRDPKTDRPLSEDSSGHGEVGRADHHRRL